MKFLVAANDTGGFKFVECNKGTDTSKKDSIPVKIIETFTKELPGNCHIVKFLIYQDKYLICARADGSICIHEYHEDDLSFEKKSKDGKLDTLKLIKTFKLNVQTKDKPIALINLVKFNSILIAFESSKVFIIQLNDEFSFEPIDFILPNPKPISAFTGHPEKLGVFAYGGKENDLKLIKIFDTKISWEEYQHLYKSNKFQQHIIFSAKNIKPDHLDLRVPIWITQIQFITKDVEKGFKLIATTNYGQIRIYDTVHGKRPLKDFKICDQPIVALQLVEDQQACVISNTSSLIAKYSLTKVDENAHKTNSASAGTVIKPVAKLLGKFSEGGNTGATFGICCKSNLVATAGLDRYIRVFDVNSRKLLAKVFISVEISDIIIIDSEDEIDPNTIPEETKAAKRKRINEEDDESDEEEIWEQLENSKKPKSSS